MRRFPLPGEENGTQRDPAIYPAQTHSQQVEEARSEPRQPDVGGRILIDSLILIHGQVHLILPVSPCSGFALPLRTVPIKRDGVGFEKLSECNSIIVKQTRLFLAPATSTLIHYLFSLRVPRIKHKKISKERNSCIDP